MEEFGNKDVRKEEVFSRVIRAGKRTYFFDVKATRSGENYLTITESKRRFDNEQGKFFYEKHKIFLYKEDFNKFMEALNNTINHVKTELMPDVDFSSFEHNHHEEKEAVEAAKPGVDSELKWD